jgi:hypothetical protein
MDPRRVELARAFLQEAVFRARDAGARAEVAAGIAGAASNCGLGEGPVVDTRLSPRAAEIFASLWGPRPPAAIAEAVAARTRAWVEAQDQLDRDRNHFLKAFRQRHGLERAKYAPAVSAEFEAGLERVNAAARDALEAAAAELAGTT